MNAETCSERHGEEDDERLGARHSRCANEKQSGACKDALYRIKATVAKRLFWITLARFRKSALHAFP